jgi:CRISPR-associated exonuclease Cas4
MERENDLVLQGRVIGEESYDRRQKEINIDNVIVLDSFDRKLGIIHEVKKSKSIQRAHIKQVQYYLYYLSNRGIQAEAEIEYPLLKRKEHVTLSEADRIQLEADLVAIQRIISLPRPPDARKKKICYKCSYYEICYI